MKHFSSNLILWVLCRKLVGELRSSAYPPDHCPFSLFHFNWSCTHSEGGSVFKRIIPVWLSKNKWKFWQLGGAHQCPCCCRGMAHLSPGLPIATFHLLCKLDVVQQLQQNQSHSFCCWAEPLRTRHADVSAELVPYPGPVGWADKHENELVFYLFKNTQTPNLCFTCSYFTHQPSLTVCLKGSS